MAGDFPADLTPEEGAKGVIYSIVDADSSKKGTLSIIKVAGKENLEDLHKYDERHVRGRKVAYVSIES